MTRIGRLLGVLVLCLAFTAPVRSFAYDGPGCGGSFTGSASCGPFAVRGTPIIVQGDSTGTHGSSVHVWMSIYQNPEVPPLFECSATSGTGAVSCDHGYPNEDRNQAHNVPGSIGTILFMCNVQGSGSGGYYCQTGFNTASS